MARCLRLFGVCVFELRHAVERAQRRHTSGHPSQLRRGWQVGLDENGRNLGVEARRDVHGGAFTGFLPQFRRVLRRRNRM